MIDIFNNNQFIPRFHKNNEKYGDYILALSGEYKSIVKEKIERTNKDRIRLKIRKSIYFMDWYSSPQKEKFWDEYFDSLTPIPIV